MIKGKIHVKKIPRGWSDIPPLIVDGKTKSHNNKMVYYKKQLPQEVVFK